MYVLKLRVVRIFDKVTKYFFNPKIYYTKLRVVLKINEFV